ncbi:hypothetical protein J31TS4_23170 [Paenibacillus sp. J31TS4]|uniref:hypothetical protein n=1 Tax=Paenibacillus sp. J31TS4 TaxID=2807195 RepID=UPI001B16F5D6|nr:hypothetical protein [Paenibacillus sp. J31TS4]GIP39037.1 hypothetical protein J31TS4_23170 [Paenibacillus sp. J31TS4]
MKVCIYIIKREVDEGFIVRFNSSYGDGIATYVGKRPIVNIEYFVEIDVKGIFKWGEDISRIENNQCKIEVMGKLVSLYGMLESVDEDGYTVLRLGQSIVPIETEGSPYPIGSYIKIQSPNVKLYDIGF